MNEPTDDRPDLHAPSARVAAGRVPWRRLKAVLLAAAVGLLAWALHETRQDLAEPAPVRRAQSSAPQPRAPGESTSASASARKALPRPQAVQPPPMRLPRFASFGAWHPTADVRHVADWAVDSGDPQGRAFVIVDKRDASVWLFDPRGDLVSWTPALVGAAVGDDAVPGIGEKPLAAIRPEEKTTPAGRYVAEPGVNANGEDVVWVSYDLAVSMHRVRPTVAAERRLERLASATPGDNRISFGCINLPVDFYEQVLAPMVRRTGAVIYVLPETRSPQAQFNSYDVASHSPLALSWTPGEGAHGLAPMRTAHVK